MNLNIILGAILTFFAIYFGAPELRNDFGLYLRGDAFILVIGGTIASTMTGVSIKEFGGIFKVVRVILFGSKNQLDIVGAINTMISVSEAAQSTSKQNLGASFAGKDGFLDRGLEMVAAGIEKDFIDQTLETDISELVKRHNKMTNVIRTMGSYCPMFGMLGTILGVIQVLKDVSSIDTIIAGMSLALLTTLYGLFFSSIIFIPLTNKLKSLSNDEKLSKEIIREGILLVMDKEIPLKVEKYLTSYITSNEKEKFAKS
tara:strand:+ start:5757 stop:6530 length:774 start_codon:yes stop_codon:yes gene_type:complete